MPVICIKDSQADNSWHWSQYWSANRVAACFEGAGSNYEQPIQSLWRDFFRSLPPSARILDIGTGNGAVPIIAWHTGQAEGSDFSISAVDAADINPSRHVQQDSDAIAHIEFRGNISAESMPFDDDSFDAISSQYALEYMEQRSVLPELYRVAAPGAQLMCVIHSESGAAASGAQRELLHCAYLLHDSGLFDKTRRAMAFVTQLERSGVAVTAEDDARARKLINGFETALRRLRKRCDESGDNLMLKNALELCARSYQQRRQFSTEQLLENINLLQREVQAHSARLQDLVRASLGNREIEALAAGMETAGFDVAPAKTLLRPGSGASLGWVLQGSRPGTTQ